MTRSCHGDPPNGGRRECVSTRHAENPCKYSGNVGCPDGAAHLRLCAYTQVRRRLTYVAATTRVACVHHRTPAGDPPRRHHQGTGYGPRDGAMRKRRSGARPDRRSRTETGRGITQRGWDAGRARPPSRQRLLEPAPSRTGSVRRAVRALTRLCTPPWPVLLRPAGSRSVAGHPAIMASVGFLVPSATAERGIAPSATAERGMAPSATAEMGTSESASASAALVISGRGPTT